MTNLEEIKEVFKPYKYTIFNNCIIFESMEGKYISKEEKNKNIKEIYTYLKSRNFINYVPLCNEDRTKSNIFPYIEEIDTPLEQKIEDMIVLVSNLHYQTSYNKEVTKDKYEEIYESIDNNINYLKDKYDILFKIIDEHIYMPPDEYLLIRNQTEIINSLDFCSTNLEKWYDLVKDKSKMRVCLVHNNLKEEHFIKSNSDYLISWDNATVDSPIKDLLCLYKEVWSKVNFIEIYNRYIASYPLNEHEVLLLLILISIPDEIELSSDRMKNIVNIRLKLDYLFKTDKFIKEVLDFKSDVEDI